MAINEKLTDRVREVLVHVEHVEEKKMFSGIAFMVDEKLCIAVRGDNIMLRIDPAAHDELVEKPGCSSMIMKGKDLDGYVVVDESVLTTQKQLVYWVRLALDYNPKAKATKKKSRRAK
ncbi:MAG TPA: TfoX/Sxy family protein [Parafilimonas sp.]|nr:TfoX/Sxy family protein [Parafilimonas sp.]